LVVTRYGHTPPRHSTKATPHSQAAQSASAHGVIEIVEAAHPVPDAAGMAAAQRILQSVQGLTAHDLVLCLISGGGSALLTLPATWPGGGLTLADKQRINQALLHSGANIGEMNTVRRHLSAIKGGRLAAACAPARVVTLTISDVPGDDPSVIASGPTVPDPSTCADALAILERHRIALPDGLREQLQSGALETPKPGDPRLADQPVHLIATPRQSLEAAAQAALAAGIAAHVLGDDIEGESREVAKVHAALARSVALHGTPFARPCVILSGGETTVTVRAAPAGQALGRGGRAGEFCLGAAMALQGLPGVYALAADTDGIDGVEDNAGALLTPDTLARAAAAGLLPQTHADRHDSYGFFAALGDLVVTGPTHTNVNDFRAVLVL
jgi:hydroxypyruvate reductase